MAFYRWDIYFVQVDFYGLDLIQRAVGGQVLAAQIPVNRDSRLTPLGYGVYHRGTGSGGITGGEYPRGFGCQGKGVDNDMLAPFCQGGVSHKERQAGSLSGGDNHGVSLDKEFRSLYRDSVTPPLIVRPSQPHPVELHTFYLAVTPDYSQCRYQVVKFDPFFLGFGNLIRVGG